MNEKSWEEEFDEFVEELQRQIIEQDKKDFSEHALSLGLSPPYYGKLKGENVITGFARSECGDGMWIYLELKNHEVARFSFEIDGCVASTMAGAQLMLLLKDRSIEDIKKIRARDIINALGKYPKENWHCASLAIESLRDALSKL